jgi:hypothetical protein
MLETPRIELYGRPNDRLMEQLQGVSVSWPVIVKTHLQRFVRHEPGYAAFRVGSRQDREGTT